jgi:hypothetical protein
MCPTGLHIIYTYVDGKLLFGISILAVMYYQNIYIKIYKKFYIKFSSLLLISELQ